MIFLTYRLNLPNATISLSVRQIISPILTPFYDMFKPLGWQLNFREEHLRAIFHSALHEMLTVEAFQIVRKEGYLKSINAKKSKETE